MGDDRTALMSAMALSPGYEIMWYTIEEVLGQGGFGITYLAHDRNLERRVAIKEYLPTPFAYRHQDYSVKPLTGDHREDYSWGLDSFLKEAQTLAKFGHENIVRVHSVFEANNTAYMVMEYEHGENLASVYKNVSRVLDQQFFETTFFPIFRGLEEIHQLGFIHRDIKPANIYIRENGTPVLIDFGSARQTSQQQTGELTTLVSKGFTPLEQYSPNYGDQGPWTDIYSLAASMYEGIVGAKPDEALSRSACMLRNKPDLVERLAATRYTSFDQQFLDSICSGLALEPEGRPQNLSEWLRQFRSLATDSIQNDDEVSLGYEEQTQTQPGFDDDLLFKSNDFIRPGAQVSSYHETPPIRNPDLDMDFDFPDSLSDENLDIFKRETPHLNTDHSVKSDRRARLDKEVSKKRSKVIPITMAIAILSIVSGATYYYLQPKEFDTVVTLDSIAKLPQPQTPLKSVLAQDLTVWQLEELVVLAGLYQQAYQLDADNQEIVSGVADAYDSLGEFANSWNAERFGTITGLIKQANQKLPGTTAQSKQLLAILETAAEDESSELVKSLIESGNIMQPADNSVFDEARKLGPQRFQQLRESEQWQQMMQRFRNSAIAGLEASNFELTVGIVEAALTIDPDDEQMQFIEQHLRLRYPSVL